MAYKKIQNKTPAELGFSMPAEWERHEATWLVWPHNRSDWPGKLVPVQWVYAEICRKITPGEIVRIIVNSKDHEFYARRMLERARVDMSRVEFFRWSTNRGWARDFGPIFVKRRGPRPEIAVVDFNFNAWAKYPTWQKDRRIARRAAKAMGVSLFTACANQQEFVLEGGGIDVNGSGLVLTTEECYLDQRKQVRNPGMKRRAFRNALREYLGINHALWLGKGIAGDDTHGHIDDIARFVREDTVVIARENDKKDSNRVPLRENGRRLEKMRTPDGRRLNIVTIPMPAPLYCGPTRLPASYANFYISNSAVIVPTFNDPADRIALGILAELFPKRHVVGIHCVDLVLGLGTLHCLTQQQPAI